MDLKQLKEQFDADLSKVVKLEDIEGIKVKYLGRKSHLKAGFKNLKSLSVLKKTELAKGLNSLNTYFSKSIVFILLETKKIHGSYRFKKSFYFT